MGGKHVLTIAAATAPTDYIYENLPTSWLSRLLRRSFSNAVVAVVLIISFALVVVLKSYQKDLVVCTTHYCLLCQLKVCALQLQDVFLIVTRS